MRRWAIFSWILLLLFSCRKEVDIFVDEDPITDPPAELVYTSINGQVVNELSLPVSGVLIKVRDYEILTDENGYFELNNILANKYGTQITASKEGFVRNILTVYPRLNQQMFKVIVLTQKVNSATFLTTQGTTVSMGSQTSLVIPPNSIVNATDGSDHSGQVLLKWTMHDITDAQFANLVPGELTGIDSSKTSKGLAPLGVIQMEMTDANGQPLRLAQGKTARMNYQVPASYKGSLEEKIPSWTFDTKKYRWVRNGDGYKKTAQTYEAQLSSISAWCLAYPEEIVSLSGTLTAPEGTGLKNFAVTVHSGINRLEVTTDNSGYFYIKVPANKALTVEILNDCGYMVKKETLAPAAAAITFDKQLEEGPDCRTIPIQGTLVDCDGEKITNGYIYLKSNNNSQFIRSDQDGKVIGQFRVCGDIREAKLEAVDSENNIQSALDVNVFIGQMVQLGELKICDRLEGTFSLQFNDHIYLLNDEIGFLKEGNDVIMTARSGLLEIECAIFDFNGEGTYLIPNESSPDFLVTFTPFSASAPKLFPKDLAALSTYTLQVTKYIPQQVLEGKIEGLARDENNSNESGMMYIKFNIPLKQ